MLLEILAQALHASGHPGDAARLHGATAAIRATLGTPVLPVDRNAIDALHRCLIVELGASACHAHMAEGVALGLYAAMVEAHASCVLVVQEDGRDLYARADEVTTARGNDRPA